MLKHFFGEGKFIGASSQIIQTQAALRQTQSCCSLLMSTTRAAADLHLMCFYIPIYGIFKNNKVGSNLNIVQTSELCFTIQFKS